MVEVKAKLEKRNRAGLTFNREFKLVEVTEEQKSLIEADDYLELREVTVVGEKSTSKRVKKQTK